MNYGLFCSSPLLTIQEVSFLEPRSKFKVVIGTTGIYFENSSSTGCFAPYSCIKSIIAVPNLFNTKKGNEDLLILIFDSVNPLKYNNKSLPHCIIVLNRDSTNVEATHFEHVHKGSESSVVQELLLLLCSHINKVIVPNRDIFQSKTLKDNMWQYIKCYKGTQEGKI